MTNINLKIESFLISTLVFLTRILAIQLYWIWFIVPLGFPSIKFVHAIGLHGLYLTLRAGHLLPSALTREELRRERIISLWFYLFAIFVGWVLHFFI